MIFVLRLVILLLGLLFVWMGLGFLVSPTISGSDFGLVAIDNGGLSSIRADFTAFFWVSGGAFLIAAWRVNREILLVTVALMGITLIGRAVSLAVDGTYDGWFLPMTVEALTVLVGLAGYRLLPAATVSAQTGPDTAD